MNAEENLDNADVEVSPYNPDASGALSAIAASPDADSPQVGGLTSVDPVARLNIAKQRMEQLTELKKRMAAQAAARKAAMEQLASAYESNPYKGVVDPGLLALGANVATNPNPMAGFIGGMQGMEDVSRKLAEREWARKASAQKIRAETEQQGMTDILNEGRLDQAMLQPVGRSYAPKDYVANGHHIRDTYDPNSGQWAREDLGVAPSGMRGSAIGKPPVGKMWKDEKDPSQGYVNLPGAEKLETGMRWVDPNDTSKGMVPVKGSSKDVGPANVGDTTKAGEDYLATVPKESQDLVRSIAEGKVNPTSLSTKGGHRERILGMVTKYDPEYNQQRYVTAQKTMNEFTTGRQGNTVRSFNVALEHLDTLAELGKALDNNDLPAINKMANYFSQQTGSPKVTNFDGAKHLVADEIVKAMVGGGAALADREAAANTINAANSPKQLSDMVETYKKLFGGQINGLRKQYESGTGRRDFEDVFLTPQGKKMAAQANHGEGSSAALKTNAKGWVLHTDSKGRKAYVSPDKTQYEVVK